MNGPYLDPRTGLPAIDDGTGTHRLLALLPPSGPMALPEFKAYHAPIPESEWRDISLFDVFDPPVLDQGQHGSCVGHGGDTGFTLSWLAMGEPLVRFSACYLYSLLNEGRDQGASIGATIEALQKYGICLESTVPEGAIFRNQYDAAAADTEAANYRLVEAYRTSDPADVATALQMGYAVVDSVMVGRNFNTLDVHGVVGLDRGPGNHCVCKGGMKRLPSGQWVFHDQNSWSDRWGVRGRFYSTIDHILNQSYYEACVYRAITPGPNAPKFPG